MASLLETRKKIRSVHQTRKITKAMQLVSASKMKIFQKKAVSSRQYAWDLLEVLKRHTNPDEKLLFMEKRKSGKTLFILYSSDKGLCGPLNTKLFKALLTSEGWTKTPISDRLLITIGKKAHDFALFNEIPVEKHFKGLKERMSTLDALSFIAPIIEYWEQKIVKKICIIAPHYKSTLVFYPVVKTLLPFSFEMIENHINLEGESKRDELIKKSSNSYMLYEPDQPGVIEVLIEQVIQMLFLESFFELKATEYSSRMIAMQNATDNATDLISDLTLLYNKARQSKITQELSEMAGTMAALG